MKCVVGLHLESWSNRAEMVWWQWVAQCLSSALGPIQGWCLKLHPGWKPGVDTSTYKPISTSGNSSSNNPMQSLFPKCHLLSCLSSLILCLACTGEEIGSVPFKEGFTIWKHYILLKQPSSSVGIPPSSSIWKHQPPWAQPCSDLGCWHSGPWNSSSIHKRGCFCCCC